MCHNYHNLWNFTAGADKTFSCSFPIVVSDSNLFNVHAVHARARDCLRLTRERCRLYLWILLQGCDYALCTMPCTKCLVRLITL